MLLQYAELLSYISESKQFKLYNAFVYIDKILPFVSLIFLVPSIFYITITYFGDLSNFVRIEKKFDVFSIFHQQLRNWSQRIFS